MDLREYLRLIRRRWWLPVSAVVIAVAIAVLTTLQTPPQYATSVTFFVTTPAAGVSDAYQGGLFSQQRVKSYSDLLTSDRLARAVADNSSFGLTAAELQSRVQAAAVADTVLLRATVTDGNGARSRAIADVLANQFITLVQTLETPPGSGTPSIKVEVISGPTLNTTPVSPRPLYNVAVAGLLGLLVGVAAAVLRDVLDTTVKTTQLLQDLTGAPLLGTVPFDPSARKAPLIVSGSSHSARAEAYRQLRTNLQFVDIDHPARVIVVTSAIPDEGKSTTSSNLAIAFAEAGSRVVLIEADLRKPRMADYLGVEGAIGLTNVLAGQVSADNVLQQWGGTGLWVLPSGSIPPNPSELLGSQSMVDLLKALTMEFDIVILDTPPLLPVTDGAVVAARADGAILVTRYGRASRTQVAAARNALRAVDARVLGSVFNMAPAKGEANYVYDYGYGYADPARGNRQALEDVVIDDDALVGRGITTGGSGPRHTDWP